MIKNRTSIEIINIIEARARARAEYCRSPAAGSQLVPVAVLVDVVRARLQPCVSGIYTMHMTCMRMYDIDVRYIAAASGHGSHVRSSDGARSRLS